MINFHLFGSTEPNKCRRVGMADEADSKSVVGNHVRVQVPPPAPDNDNPNPVPIGAASDF